MTRMKALFGSTSLVTTVVLLVVAWGPGCDRPQVATPSISVAYIENASCWPLFVALDKGLFEANGVTVDVTVAKDSSEALNALLAGKVDASIENSYSALFAIEGKSPGTIKLFLPCSETAQKYVSHLLVPVGSEVRRPEDLKGKRIGTYTGSTQLLTLKLFLRDYLGWDPEKDVQIVQVASALQVQALAAGQYDALFTIEPFASAALAKGVAQDILPYARGKILDPFPAGASSIRVDAITTRREALRRMYESMVRASEFIDRNGDESRAILAKWTNLDEDSAKGVGGYHYHTFEEFDTVKRGRVQRLADLYHEGGILSTRVEVADLFLSSEAVR